MNRSGSRQLPAAARQRHSRSKHRPAGLGTAVLGATVLALCALVAEPARAENLPRTLGGGQLDAELGALYEATGLNPFDAVGANNLAMKLVARGDYEKARKLLRRAERLDPNRLEITRNARQVQRLIDQRAELPSRARAHFRDSFAQTEVPFVTAAWVVNGRGEIGAPTEAPNARAAGDAEAASLATVGAYDDGEGALADNPFDTRWLRERAAIKMRRGEHRAALVDLRRALELDPYLSGVAREIERLAALLPENGERPMSIAPPLTGSRVSGARGNGASIELPAPWSVPDETPGGREPAR